MPICSKCAQDVPKSDFSSSQWKRKASERHCRKCVNGEISCHPLITWLIANGGSISSIDIHLDESSQSRSIVTRASISPSQELLRVPLKCMVLSNVSEDANAHHALALWLIQSKPDFFEPYIQSLPTLENVKQMAIFQPSHEALQKSFVGEMLKGRVDSLAADYSLLTNHECSFEQYMWARTIVITRAFKCGSKGTCLVPIADMMNHSAEPNVQWAFDESSQCFVMKAQKPIASGKECWDSYGNKCNSRFFVNYGFTLEHNAEWNQTVLHLPMIRELGDRLYNDGYTYGIPSIPPNVVRFQVPSIVRCAKDTSHVKLLRALMSYARVLCGIPLNAAKPIAPEDGKDGSKPFFFRHWVPFQSEPNERRAIQLIGSSARKQLLNMKENPQHPIIEGESQILQDYIHWAECVGKIAMGSLGRKMKTMYPLYYSELWVGQKN